MCNQDRSSLHCWQHSSLPSPHHGRSHSLPASWHLLHYIPDSCTYCIVLFRFCIRIALRFKLCCIRVCPCINILLFFPAVRAVLLRSMSCWVMVKDRVILAVDIQVQSIPIISVFLGKSGNDRVIIS